MKNFLNKENVDISVVITTYQRRDSLDLVLYSLQNQTFDNFEVIIVDDGGTDRSEKIAKKHSCQYFWHPHNGFGLSRSRNEGARAAVGKVLLFLDSDIMLSATSLETAWALYQEKPDRAIGGYYKYLFHMMITPADVINRWPAIWRESLPVIPMNQGKVPLDMDVRDAWRGMPHHMNNIPIDVFTFEHEVLFSPFVFLGGVMVIPSDIFYITGGFDEAITTYGGEDAEMSLAIISHGYGISYSRNIAGAHLAHEKNSTASEADEIEKRKYIARKYPYFLNPDGTPNLEVWGKDTTHMRKT